MDTLATPGLDETQSSVGSTDEKERKPMKIRSVLLSFALLAAGVSRFAGAQEGMPPLPKPGPEHDVLKAQTGTWDATMEAWMQPGAPPMTSTGVETNTLLAGMWLITDFKGDFGGTPFQGHGILGFDAVKKKYVSTWVDSMSVGPSQGEATYDPAAKTMTGWMEGPDMTGHVSKMKNVSEQKDPDTRVFTMFMPGPDGKDVPGMRITYKRRK
jgi:hypothetical protein